MSDQEDSTGKNVPQESVKLQPEAESQSSQAPAKPKESDPSAWIGAAVWLVVIGVVVFSYFYSEGAEVLLNVSAQDKLAVDGQVKYKGAPVTQGSVQITVESAIDRRYLGSAVIPLTEKGTFSTEGNKQFESIITSRKLSVTARFVGQSTQAGKEAKAEATPISGSSTVYLNMTPPLGRRAQTAVLAGLLLPIAILIVLFTGPLTQRKARLLFLVTYLVTFISCAIPIALTVLVAHNPYLVEKMEDAPVGLLKGTARGIERPQWLVNIGGAVKKGGQEVSDKAGAPADQRTGTLVPERQIPGSVDQASSGPQAAIQQPSTVSNLQPKGGLAQPISPEPGLAQVDGGLAIPLYVVILAMLGAGINMTRKVPEIQKTYDSAAVASWKGALKATVTIFGFGDSSGEIKEAPEIRQQLINTYMYFLSAPFLAIAVFYLLQVISKNVEEPVLVLIAFATGLMSNTVVGSIMAFADKILAATVGKAPQPTVAAQQQPQTVAGKKAEGDQQPAAAGDQQT